MQKIVYILGAGFSAPFNVPISSEFLDRARDVYQKYPKYSHFKEIIDIVNYYVTKKWYNIDLDNIEDLLSMLEMKRNLENTEDDTKFKKFIVDVVNAYSQTFGKDKRGDVIVNTRSQRWDEVLFDFEDRSKNNILAMLSSVFNIKYYINEKPKENEKLGISIYDVKSVINDYKPLFCNFITLNYDVILENALKYLISFTGLNLKFEDHCDSELNYENVYLAKLHGSVNTDIMLPTWNKYLNKYMKKTWSLAYKLLSDANKIIIIGYSFPETDTYIRYLLGLAAVNSFNLKNVDIICLDKNDVVLNRYKKYLNFDNGRINFYNARTEEYLRLIYRSRLYSSDREGIKQEVQFSTGIAHSNFIESINPIKINER
jgi:hypothetical protein